MPQNNRFNTLKIKVSILLLCLCTPLMAWAAAFSANSNIPIKIQSDHAELDEQNGRSTYTGDVVITQGKTILTSDKVIVYSDKNGLSKLEAFGTPAKFTHHQEGEPLPTHAYGNKITYTRADETLLLVNDAKLEQGKNTFRGTTIEYNTVSRVVTAQGGSTQGGESKPQRVEIIVHPQEKEAGDNKK